MTGATSPQTTLLLDPELPPATWETRAEKGKVLKRSRYQLDQGFLTEALDDPKVIAIAFGEQSHSDLLRVMREPGVKTPLQRAAEEAAKLKRGTIPSKKPAANPFGGGTPHVDRSTFGGLEPEPSGPQGTPEPGGTAS